MEHSKWVSVVSGELPKGHETVLIFTEAEMLTVGWHHAARDRWFKTYTVDGSFPEVFVTHWQPLPAPPAD